MAILKNINETSTDLNVLFERNNYITDPVKTRGVLFGALGCCRENFPNISRALKRVSHQKKSKMLRHYVVGISPCDEGKISNTELLKAARLIAGFFKEYYVLYAVHTDTAHTHFHILICNTRISDGKQMSMSNSDLERFKEHCSSVFREYGLRPIEKLDKNDELLEINNDLFLKELTKEEQVKILYESLERPQCKTYHGNYRPMPMQNCGNTTIVNVFLPPKTQGALFQGRNGQPCLSFKPFPCHKHYPSGNTPQIYAVCDGNTAANYPMSEPPSYPSKWFDQEPEWIKDELSSDNDDSFDDYYDDDQDVIAERPSDDKALNSETLTETGVTGNKIDPFIVLKENFPQAEESGKVIPFVFLNGHKE